MPFSNPQEVYKGDNPKEAIFAWSVASYCAPQRTAIKTTLHSHAKELVDTAKDNLLWFKDQCSLDDFPYRWEVIENSLNDMYRSGCKNFTDGKTYASVYPFDVA